MGSRSSKGGPCPICLATFGETPALAKHLRRRHEGKGLSSVQEAHLGLQFCSCREYWGKGESINRHYRPHAAARSQKHQDRCRLLQIDPDLPLCSDPPAPDTADLDDCGPPSPTSHVGADVEVFSGWSLLPHLPHLCARCMILPMF